jgi:isopentenyl-diphosphate Delta-isomerase
MQEIVLVNEKDNQIGLMEKEECHKHPVKLHRAISVLIFDPKGQKILLQRRSKDKCTWPLFWTNTACSHPFEGEDNLTAAQRRLTEEMGITASLKEVFSFVYEARYDETYGEYEFDHVFVGSFAGEAKPNPLEVSEFKWIEMNLLREDVLKNPDSYTPWFKIILAKLASVPSAMI